MKYTAIYEREPDGRWTVEIPAVKGCHTYGRTIEQARDRVREALGLFVEGAAEAAIVDEVRLPADVRKQVADAKRLRAQLAADETRMVIAQIKAARALRGLKMGHRDAGCILNLSHQRVQQLEKRPMDMPGRVIADAASGRHTVKRALKKR